MIITFVLPGKKPFRVDSEIGALRLTFLRQQSDEATHSQLGCFAHDNRLTCAENRQCVEKSDRTIWQCAPNKRPVGWIREPQGKENSALREDGLIDLGRTLADDHGSDTVFAAIISDSLNYIKQPLMEAVTSGLLDNAARSRSRSRRSSFDSGFFRRLRLSSPSRSSFLFDRLDRVTSEPNSPVP